MQKYYQKFVIIGNKADKDDTLLIFVEIFGEISRLF